jgi:high affinity sulfate transporter 1
MSDSSAPPGNPPSWLVEHIPALGWLRTYQSCWLRPDVVAGTMLAAYLLPAGIGAASLAGLPPEAGLYACIFSGLVFWLFASSRHTAITVTSPISLLVGSSLGLLANGNAARFGALAAGTALLVAALALLAWLVRAGAVVDFISETVLVGFKIGVALQLISSQLPKLCGFAGGRGDFWQGSAYFAAHLHETRLASLAIGGTALLVLLLGKRFLPHKPVGLLVVIGSLIFGAAIRPGDIGVEMLGEVPRGLPALAMPALLWSDVNMLLPLAMACFLLAAVETAAVGRTFARQFGYRLDCDQEFLALAGANLATGLVCGYPVGGGVSQSLVNEEAGARTPLSGLVAALLMLVVTLYLSGLLRYLPQPVLAAVVLVAVTGLFNLTALKRIWRFSRSEFVVAMTALLGVLGSGLLMGVLIGAILSLVLFLRHGMRPHTTELGQVPGTDYFADLIRHPGNRRSPGVFVFRCDGAVLYFNAEFVRGRFFDLLNERGDGVKLAVFFLGTVPTLDLAGVELLADIRAVLHGRGIDFRLAEAHSGVRETLRHASFETDYGPIEPDQTVTTVIHRWNTPSTTNPT